MSPTAPPPRNGSTLSCSSHLWLCWTDTLSGFWCTEVWIVWCPVLKCCACQTGWSSSGLNARLWALSLYFLLLFFFSLHALFFARENKMFTENEIRNILFQVLSGLAFVHKHGKMSALLLLTSFHNMTSFSMCY